MNPPVEEFRASLNVHFPRAEGLLTRAEFDTERE
jgi:hypothetical protein